MLISLSELFGGGPQGPGQTQGRVPPQLAELLGGLTGIFRGHTGNKVDVIVPGEAQNTVNGKSAATLLQELNDLESTLDGALGLYAKEVEAIQSALEEANASTLGELKASVKLTELLAALDTAIAKTTKLKEENSDNSDALTELEIDVAQTIADWTALQDFDADVEGTQQTFSVTIGGPKKSVGEVIERLQAVIDEVHDRVEVPGLGPLLDKFQNGTFTFETTCMLGGVTFLSGDRTEHHHCHLNAQVAVLRRKLTKAGLKEVDGETLYRQIEETNEATDSSNEAAELDEDIDDDDLEEDDDFDAEDFDDDSDVRLADDDLVVDDELADETMDQPSETEVGG